MNEQRKDNGLGFTLSPSAREYLLKIIPSWIENCSTDGMVPVLTYSGGGKEIVKDEVKWDYRGPMMGLAGQTRERLGPGKYYDLLGHQVWIENNFHPFLKGQEWTHIKVGGPEPKTCLTIENPPADYLDYVLRGSSGDCCRQKAEST